MQIYIDADACPVKTIIIEESLAKDIPVTLVTSISHFSTKEQPPGVKTVYVDTGAEAADYRIIKLIKKGDILISTRGMTTKIAVVSEDAKYLISSSEIASKWSAENAPTSTAILELPGVNWSACTVI